MCPEGRREMKAAKVSLGTSKGCSVAPHGISSECWEVKPVTTHWTQEASGCPAGVQWEQRKRTEH